MLVTPQTVSPLLLELGVVAEQRSSGKYRLFSWSSGGSQFQLTVDDGLAMLQVASELPAASPHSHVCLLLDSLRVLLQPLLKAPLAVSAPAA